MPVPSQHFDDLAAAYEAMIDWPKRLANETPFYRRWFERVGVHSVVDVACGGGHHAAMFRDWGLRVEGADVSPAMIALARSRFGESPDLRWVTRGFDSPVVPEIPFDAALCVGNSISLAADRAMAARAMEEMLAAVRSGGMVVVHAMNLWRLPDGPIVWQKCQRAMLPQGESVILKGVHRCGNRGFVDMAVVALGEAGKVNQAAGTIVSSIGALPMKTESAPLLGLEAADCESILKAAGAKEMHLFGGYQEQPYDRAASVDWILVARK